MVVFADKEREKRRGGGGEGGRERGNSIRTDTLSKCFHTEGFSVNPDHCLLVKVMLIMLCLLLNPDSVCVTSTLWLNHNATNLNVDMYIYSPDVISLFHRGKYSTFSEHAVDHNSAFSSG